MVRRIGAPKQESITEKAEPKAVQEEQVVEAVETISAEAVGVAVAEQDVSTVEEAIVEETVVEEAPATATEESTAPIVEEPVAPKKAGTIPMPDGHEINLSNLSDVAKFNIFINMCSKYINPEFSRALFDFCCVHMSSTASKELSDFLHTMNKDTTSIDKQAWRKWSTRRI